MSFEVSHKSAEAFRTISEVADELDLPQHVLRFWETRFPHVHPMKRAGNRRYYRPQDIDLLRGIAKLLYAEGLTIKGVQKILREQGVRYVGDIGRGEADFMTPLKRARLTPVREAEYALNDFAALHMEFVQQAEAIERMEVGEDEAASNVHPLFPEQAAEPRPLTPEQRARLEELLSELLEMKSRLLAAKARVARAEISAMAADLEADAAEEPGEESEPAADCGAMG